MIIFDLLFLSILIVWRVHLSYIVLFALPSFCLFHFSRALANEKKGNTVNLTSRTETTGEPGKINVSEYAYNCLREGRNHDPDFEFTYRGAVPMKGRAEAMRVWLLTRFSSRILVKRVAQSQRNNSAPFRLY